MNLQKIIGSGLLSMMAITPVLTFAGSHVSQDGHQSGHQGVTVSDSYVRMVPPGQQNTGVFMTMKNHSDKVRTVVSAESAAAKVVELHTHIKEDGMMKMRQIAKIDIPAKGNVVLKPGGLHVMLIGLNQTIEAGKPVNVTLVFKNGEKITIKAPGRKLKMKMMHHGMGQGMQHEMKNGMKPGMHNMKH